MKIAVVGFKGGTGKTTAVMHLAGALLEQGSTVLIADADEQGDAAGWANTLGWDVVSVSGEIDKRLGADHDFVLIDTPPGDARVIGSAVSAANLVIVPVQPTRGDIAQFGETAELVNGIEDVTGVRSCVLLTRVVKRTLAARQIRDALKNYGIPVLDAEIPQAQRFALAYGEPIKPGEFNDVVSELGKRYGIG